MARKSVIRLNTFAEQAVKKATELGKRKSLGVSAEQIKALAGHKVVRQKTVRGKPGRFTNPAKVKAAAPIHPYNAPPHMEMNTPEWFSSEKMRNVDVSIIVPCFKSKEYIVKQISTWHLETSNAIDTEIIYVDDCCPQKSHRYILDSWQSRLKELSKPIGRIVLVTGKNGGFSNACNVGASLARGKHLIFLNADTRVTPGWIQPMIDTFGRHKNVGIVGNLHLREDGAIDSCGSEWNERSKMFMHIGRHVYKGEYVKRPFKPEDAPRDIMAERDVQMVTGACFAITKEMFENVGGFDTEYRVGYWEDSDICMKVHAVGFRVMFNSDSVIYHRGGHSNSGSHEYVRSNASLFKRKWVDTGFLQTILRNPNSVDLDVAVMPSQVVVYTAITNETNKYDRLKEQRKIDSTDFVAFLEKPVESSTWQCRSIHDGYQDPCRNAKIHKILSHVYFPDKEYSLWIDGSVDIKFPFSVSRLIQMHLSNCDIALFRHCKRKCLYAEAATCIKMGLDDPEIMRKQVERYRCDGYPVNQGLGECTILLRRHSDQIKKMNEMWWEEICKGSRRDQLSFNYVARKCEIKIKYFMGCLPDQNMLFFRHMHNSKRHST